MTLPPNPANAGSPLAPGAPGAHAGELGGIPVGGTGEIPVGRDDLAALLEGQCGQPDSGHQPAEDAMTLAER